MISVIVPALNEASHIEDCLRSLKDQSIKSECYEIIVVDGGSVDDTPSIARKYADKVIIQKSPGIGGARRDGAAIAKGEILAFTDADTTVPPTWLEVIEKNLEDHDASSGPIIFVDHSLKALIIQYWRKLYRFLSIFNFYYIIGANMAIRRDIYWSAGGHSNISLLDDYDLSHKLFKNGYSTVYDSEQVVYTSSRRADKLITYAITVAYGHYHYRISKDHSKLLDYPKADEMSLRCIFRF